MSTASNRALARQESFGKRLRHLAVGVLFALVLLIPKILHARRNPRSWMLFRIFLGVAGAALGAVTLRPSQVCSCSSAPFFCRPPNPLPTSATKPASLALL